MPTGAEEIAAGKAALAIIQMANQQGWLEKLKDLFRKKHKIILLGSTGVGKSNFIDSLQSLVPATVDRLKRTEWAGEERVRLAGNVFDFFDTPGQNAHRPRRLEAVRQILGEEKFGVVNVVCFGYHEYATGGSEALANSSQADPKWLETHRALEIEAAAEWAPLMTARPSFVITLATKADLWWPDREAVVDYYQNGKYYSTVRDAAIKGHVVVPYSSVFHPFYDRGPMSGFFGTAQRTACQERLLEELFISAARTM